MRIFLAFTTLITLGFGVNGWGADTPTTNPTAGMSAHATLLYWADHIESESVDDTLSTYNFSDDTQKRVAVSMAKYDVAMSRLQKAVREKWGKDAEIALQRACRGDTREDDVQADVTETGDHAIIKYKREELQPLSMVRVDGQWKVDTAGLIAQSGTTPEQNVSYGDQCTVILNYTRECFDAGKYSAADQLVGEIGPRLARVQ